MPRRRTQDVVRVVMTDHRIQRRPPPGDLLAPLAEHDPDISSVEFLDRDAAPAGALGEVYRAVTVLRVMPRNTAATEHLKNNIAATTSPVPRFDLIAAQLQQHQFQAALETLATLDPRDDERHAAARLARHRGGRHRQDGGRPRRSARRRVRGARSAGVSIQPRRRSASHRPRRRRSPSADPRRRVAS